MLADVMFVAAVVTFIFTIKEIRSYFKEVSE
nr:MAG TPA: hypothetical protein [Caudoviricetes sp.]